MEKIKIAQLLITTAILLCSFSEALARAPKKILMIVGDYSEDYEVIVPYQTLETLGYKVDVVCPKKKAGDKIRTSIHYMDGAQTFQETRGHDFELNFDFDAVKPETYAGLVLPGGRAPEYLRNNKKILEYVTHFAEADKPIAAVCHGPLILAAANVLEGRSCTAYPEISIDLINVGAKWVDSPGKNAVVDGNLVTARDWSCHPDWMAKFHKLLETENKTQK